MYNINGKARGKWCGTYLDLVSRRTHGFSNDETSRHMTTTLKKKLYVELKIMETPLKATKVLLLHHEKHT